MDEHTFSAVVLAVMMSVVLSPTLLRLHLSRSSKTASCRALFCPFAPLPLCTPSTRPPNALRTSSSHPAPRTPPPYSAGHRAGRARHRAAADECAAHLGRARRLRLLPAAGAPRSSHRHARARVRAHTRRHTHTYACAHTHAHAHARIHACIQLMCSGCRPSSRRRGVSTPSCFLRFVASASTCSTSARTTSRTGTSTSAGWWSTRSSSKTGTRRSIDL